MTTMRRSPSFVYVAVGALAVAVVVLGVLYYQERQRTAGFSIQLNESGIEVEAGN